MMRKFLIVALMALCIPNAQAQVTSTASSSSSQALMAAGEQAGFGTLFVSQGMAKPGGCAASGMALCVIGGLSAAQAILDLTAKKNAQAVQAATSSTTAASDGATTTGGLTGASTADTGQAQLLADQANGTLTSLAGQGIKISPDGQSFTTPAGTFASSSAANPDTMKAMGLNDAQIASTLAAVASAAKKGSGYDVAAMPTSDGGGSGGAASNRGGTNGDGDGGGSNLKALLASMKKRAPSSTSGLSKKLGTTGENIGVSGDNIFQMVSRQYIKKDAQNSFLKTP